MTLPQWLKIFICVILLKNIHVYCLLPPDEQIVKITFIEDAVKKGAVCLDGSPGAYHLAEGSGDGVDKWIIYLRGGGWCISKEDCLSRSKQILGSNKNRTETSIGVMLSPKQYFSPDFYNWNRVVIRYCDGASFMADVEAVDPQTNLHLRGGRIFSAVIEELLAKGMSKATYAILAGNSAGGLATILNCDRFRGNLPPTTKVKCIADSGLFIHAKDLPGVEYREGFYSNVTTFHGLLKSLPTSCTSKMDPNLCLFAEYVIPDVKTPLFILNSDFDTYQISFNLPAIPDKESWSTCTKNFLTCTPDQLKAMKDFRTSFLKTLEGLVDNPSRGMFINSCYTHDFLYKKDTWKGPPTLENKNIEEAIGDWLNDTSIRLIDTTNVDPLNCSIGS